MLNINQKSNIGENMIKKTILSISDILRKYAITVAIGNHGPSVITVITDQKQNFYYWISVNVVTDLTTGTKDPSPRFKFG